MIVVAFVAGFRDELMHANNAADVVKIARLGIFERRPYESPSLLKVRFMLFESNFPLINVDFSIVVKAKASNLHSITKYYLKLVVCCPNNECFFLSMCSKRQNRLGTSQSTVFMWNSAELYPNCFWMRVGWTQSSAVWNFYSIQF